MAVLKLNSKTILKYFDGLNQETQITIHKGAGKPIEVIKKYIFYDVENNKTLVILDKYNSELFLINIASIRSIKFNGKRFGTNTWWNDAKNVVINGDYKEKVSI